jgi:hypothetical protein
VYTFAALFSPSLPSMLGFKWTSNSKQHGLDFTKGKLKFSTLSKVEWPYKVVASTQETATVYIYIARDNKKKLEHVMLKVVFFISSYFSKYILLENIEKYYHLFIFKKLFLTLTHQNNPKYIYKKS